ncbi:hypothetical protein ACTFIV_004601 [Dictyostelium citrinum]
MKKIIFLISVLFFFNNITITNCETLNWLKDKKGIHNGFNVCASVIIGAFIVGTPVFLIVKLILDHVNNQNKEKQQIQEAQKRISKKNEMMKQNSVTNGASSPKSTTSDSYNSSKMLREVIERTPSLDKIFVNNNNNNNNSNSNNNSSTSSTPGNQSPPIGGGGGGSVVDPNNASSNLSSPTSLSPNSTRKNNNSKVENSLVNLKNNATLDIHSTEVVQTYLIKKECEPQLLVVDGVNQLLFCPPSPVLSTFGKSTIGASNSGNNRNSEVSPILEASFFNGTGVRRSTIIDENDPQQIQNKQKNKELIDSIDSLMNATLTSSQQYQLRKLSNASSTTSHQNHYSPNIQSGNNTPTRQSVLIQQGPLNTSNSSNGGSNQNSGFRPKSLTMSQNISLLNYLSTNVMPKDYQWGCIVQRLLELFQAYLIYTNNQSSHGKYTDSTTTSQATFSSLNQFEMAISSYSDSEKIKKRISTINDQRYFSPITFELYNKIVQTHEFIRQSKRTSERDVTGIIGIFSILVPPLFRSLSKYYDQDSSNQDFLEKLKTFERTKSNLQEFTSLSLLASYQSKKLVHKISTYNLIDYLKTLTPISYKANTFNTLFSIVDQVMGISDEIDKILFQCEEFKKELFLQTQPQPLPTQISSPSSNYSKSRGSQSIPIDHDILDMVKLDLLQKPSSPPPPPPQQQQQSQQLECAIDINDCLPQTPNIQSSTKPFIPPIKVQQQQSSQMSPQITPRTGGVRYSPRLQTLPSPRPSPRLHSQSSPRIQLQQSSPRHSPRLQPQNISPRPVYELNKMDDDLKFLDFLNTNNNSINRSICNKLDEVDFKIKTKPTDQSNNNNNNNNGGNGDFNLQKQKNILSSCYSSLESCLNLFSLTDRFPSKCKADSIPIIKLLLSTLQNLEDYVDTGISIEQMITLDFMEWANNYSKTITSLNNTLIKNYQNFNNSPKVVSPNIQSINNNTNNNNINNNNTNNTSRLSKIRTLSTPFGIPASVVENNNNNNNNSNNNSINGGNSPRYNSNGGSGNSPNVSPRLGSMNNIEEEELGMNNNDCLILRRIREFKIPNVLERSQHLIDLSQECVMITILSCFSLCYKELNSVAQKSPSTIPQLPQLTDDKQTVEFFNNSLSIFLSSIRTSIFCTTLLLSPVYFP